MAYIVMAGGPLPRDRRRAQEARGAGVPHIILLILIIIIITIIIIIIISIISIISIIIIYDQC